MITLIIPTYRNPEYLDICLKSAIEQQEYKNEIIVAVDGFIEESQKILDKYKDNINVLDLGENQGMQTALNLAVMNANNEIIFIVNDDNVFCSGWDYSIVKDLAKNQKTVLTLNQIEPTGPGIFNFPVNNFGKKPNEFEYEEFIKYEKVIKNDLYPTKEGITMGEVLKEINIQSKGNAAIVSDVGQHQMIACRYAEFNKTKSNITSGGLGTMGFGLPAAIGAKMAAPD